MKVFIYPIEEIDNGDEEDNGRVRENGEEINNEGELDNMEELYNGEEQLFITPKLEIKEEEGIFETDNIKAEFLPQARILKFF